MNRKVTIWLVGVMIVLGVLLGIISSTVRYGPVHQDREPTPPPSDIVITAKLIVSFVNVFLILSLLIIYLDIFLAVRSRFALGLIAAISALLVYAMTSNPIFQMVLGYPVAGSGPFLFIPDIFTAIAAAVLVYLSIE
jgi:hypothetical protein